MGIPKRGLMACAVCNEVAGATESRQALANFFKEREGKEPINPVGHAITKIKLYAERFQEAIDRYEYLKQSVWNIVEKIEGSSKNLMAYGIFLELKGLVEFPLEHEEIKHRLQEIYKSDPK